MIWKTQKLSHSHSQQANNLVLCIIIVNCVLQQQRHFQFFVSTFVTIVIVWIRPSTCICHVSFYALLQHWLITVATWRFFPWNKLVLSLLSTDFDRWIAITFLCSDRLLHVFVLLHFSCMNVACTHCCDFIVMVMSCFRSVLAKSKTCDDSWKEIWEVTSQFSRKFETTYMPHFPNFLSGHHPSYFNWVWI
mgnify:CR=1 FL=1